MSSLVPGPIVRARRLAGAILILSLVVVLVGIALLANWYLTRPVAIAAPTASSSLTASAGGSTSTTGTSASPSVKPKPRKPSKAELERSALSKLEAQAAQDLDQADFDGRWVAQLASKYVGVKDPLQRTKTGSHTFKAVDILAEHQSLRKKFSQSSDVLLLRSDTFSPYKTHDGDPFWYTFVDDGFSSKGDVQDFCSGSFPRFSGTDLLNLCLPRELN